VRPIGADHMRGIIVSFRHLKRPVILMAALVLALTSCRSFAVRSDWDEGVDFAALTRFHLVDPPIAEGANPFADNTLLRKRIRRAAKTVLLDAGFGEAAERADADFVVTYQVLVEERLRVDGVSSTVGTDFSHRGLGLSSAVLRTRSSGYQESTLLIDVLDPESNDLIWRGWAVGIVETRDRDRGTERLFEGVRAIFRAFPPGEKR
jgi:hypothetical protein